MNLCNVIETANKRAAHAKGLLSCKESLATGKKNTSIHYFRKSGVMITCALLSQTMDEIDAVIRFGDSRSICRTAVQQGGVAESITDVPEYIPRRSHGGAKSVAELIICSWTWAIKKCRKRSSTRKVYRNNMCWLLGVAVGILLAVIVIAIVLDSTYHLTAA
ncbi:unnamed protein product [Peronospora belbahrii]|uniref:Uncharacterized protein n=1 Tax=Peronospora belbahrii TaxID=622444 RepID=A0AAU9KMJ7_9STRA|nr:unnamed protein product [Peronospora belbahrii]